VNRLTGCWKCGVLLVVGNRAKVVIRHVCQLVDGEVVACELVFFYCSLLWVTV